MAKKTPWYYKVRLESNGCWTWIGKKNQYGYGLIQTWYKGTRGSLSAHRVVYELLRGPIPAGMQIDHLCLHKDCVNPNHVEVVTQAENMRRANKCRHATIKCLPLA